MGIAGWAFVEQIENYEAEQAEIRTTRAIETESNSLRAAVSALAATIDGDLHETLTSIYRPMEFDEWDAAPEELQEFRASIQADATRLSTTASIRTYRIKNESRLLVSAQANGIHPNALQEFFSIGDETESRWGQDVAYSPDMELPLVPHQPVAGLEQTESGPIIMAYAAIEDAQGEHTGFVRLEKPAPQFASIAPERIRTLLPLMLGGGFLMLGILGFCSARLRKDIERLRVRVASIGKRNEGVGTQSVLSDLSGLFEEAEQTDQKLARRIRREEEARVDLERRLRDAELGLCPSRSKPRARFAEVSKSIAVTISVDNSHAVPGTLVDLTLEEAIIGFPVGGAVDLAPGFPARIRISSPGDDQIAEFTVETLKRTSVGKNCLLRLRITNPASLRSLPRELRHLVDNRRTLRVRPDPRNPVIARLALGRTKEERNARLIDLSAEGAGLQIKEDLWQLSSWGASVELRLVLPETEETIRIAGRISNATRSGGHIRLGVEFDLKRMANRPHYRKLEEYLSGRQAELRNQMRSRNVKNSRDKRKGA